MQAPGREAHETAQRRAGTTCPSCPAASPKCLVSLSFLLSALLERGRATLADLRRCLLAYAQIPLRLLDVDLEHALEIASENGMYAYDAYLVACALSQRAPLVTLDRELARVARKAGAEVLEIPT